jgi:hypothetical protein
MERKTETRFVHMIQSNEDGDSLLDLYTLAAAKEIEYEDLEEEFRRANEDVGEATEQEQGSRRKIVNLKMREKNMNFNINLKEDYKKKRGRRV